VETDTETAHVKSDHNRKPATTDVIVIKNEPEEDLSQERFHGGIFDGADTDYSRFMIKDYEIKDESIISSKQNVYVDFPILRLKPDEIQILEARMPAYTIAPKETDENKEARLLLTLVEKKRYNVFLKTMEFFNQKYPKSEYRDVIDFMLADVYYRSWRQSGTPSDLDMAVVKYQEAIRNNPKSPLNDRSSLFMAYAKLERGDQLGALQLFKPT